MEFNNSLDKSSIYGILDGTQSNCEICYSISCPSPPITTPCGHSFCKPCLSSYYFSCKDSFQLYPFNCPYPFCEIEIHASLSSVLDPDEYSRFKRLRKRHSLLKDPTVIWCPIINCHGYGKMTSDPSVKCKNCETLLSDTKQPDDEDLARLSLVRCPSCSAWVSRTFGCMKVRCFCGEEFCLKCRKKTSNHQYWKCLSSDEKDETSFYFIFCCLFSNVLVPIFPALFVFWYRGCWDKNYFYLVNERPWFYGFLLVIFSPMILVFSLFYLPFVWGYYCVDAMMNERAIKKQGLWVVFKLFIYFPSVLLIFLIWLLVLGLAISFAPIFGLFLIGKELKLTVNK